ncbi:MAG: hypothetical protein K2P67_09100 [Gallionellaceae bacterium]|nr:hypothetical protein [Gallionellaceae bacterium]
MQDSNKNYPKTIGMLAEINRAASLLAALVYLITAYFFGSSEAFHLAVIIVVLPLGCIWYGNEIGSFADMSADGEGEAGNVVGTLITISGWIVLLAMLAAIVFSASGNSR